MTVAKRIVLLVFVFTTCLGCDQVTKSVAKDTLVSNHPISLLRGFINLQYTENSGLMLGIGSALPHSIRFWLFTVVVGGIGLGLLSFVLASSFLETNSSVALTLVAAGACGNILDRIFKGDVVIDFVTVGFGDVRTAVFNVADVAILCGIGLFVFFHGRSLTGQGTKP
jgi:signal peptidase II